MNWILNCSRRYKKQKRNFLKNLFQKMTNTENNNVGSKLNQPHKKEQKRMKIINLLAIQLQKLIKKTSKKINEMINTRIQLKTGNAE